MTKQIQYNYPVLICVVLWHNLGMVPKKKAKVGRPSSGRSELMQLRLSPEEKDAFNRAAEEYGLSLSDWARLNLRAASMPKNDNPRPVGKW